MKVNEILDFKLINLEQYQLTVFSLSIALVLLAGAYIGLKIAKRYIKPYNADSVEDRGTRHSIYLIINYFTWVIVLVVALQVLGVKITFLLAGSAALLVGLGIGIQQIFNDIVSGMFLLFEGSVKIGDIMEIDGMVCKVCQIKLRTSSVLTRDDVIVIIPNHKFINDKVTNWSHQVKMVRFQVDVGVSYNSDPEQVRDILLSIMNNHKQVSKAKDKMPMVRFVGFGSSSLDFNMHFYTSEIFRFENIMSDMRFEIFKQFKKANIEIPFPQRDIHVKSSDLDVSKLSKILS
ncbi:MAG: mechanosensitive ion channel [Flavobacteriales bacterium]|nr:mechanosensitive ion channel [Flavobacteriales bacterium]